MNGDYDPVDTYGAPPRRPLLRAAAPARPSPSCSASARWAICSRNWDAGARAIGIAPDAGARGRGAAAGAATARRSRRRRSRRARRRRAEPERIVIDPEIARRVAALEQRLGQVGTESRAAVGNADRAEGLLVAFAARRALDRGVALGFLEALLRQRFGATQPRAVGMIILAARNPVTLQELQLGLQEVGPAPGRRAARRELVGGVPAPNWAR